MTTAWKAVRCPRKSPSFRTNNQISPLIMSYGLGESLELPDPEFPHL